MTTLGSKPAPASTKAEDTLLPSISVEAANSALIRQDATEDSSKQSEIPNNASDAASQGSTAPRKVHGDESRTSIKASQFNAEQQPSILPFWIAGFATVIWLVLGTVLFVSVVAFFRQSDEGVLIIVSNLSTAVGYIGAIFVPPGFFWTLAAVFWRSQQLRLTSLAVAQAGSQAALESAGSSIQSLRYQIVALNDGISRAIDRAGELESQVRAEVNALERSFSENENRTRNLINELASERAALANNSDRVSEALLGLGARVTARCSPPRSGPRRL